MPTQVLLFVYWWQRGKTIKTDVKHVPLAYSVVNTWCAKPIVKTSDAIIHDYKLPISHFSNVSHIP